MVEPLPKCAKLWGSTSSTTHNTDSDYCRFLDPSKITHVPFSSNIFLKSKRIILDFKAHHPWEKLGRGTGFVSEIGSHHAV